MNKILLSAALIAGFGIAAFAPQAAHAATGGTITFTGEVVENTCVLNVNGSSADGTVVLPSVLTTDLDVAGKTAGTTAFTIGVTKCNINLASVQALFSSGTIDTASGNLNNSTSTGSATGVQVQLLNGSLLVMPLNGSNAGAQNSPAVTLTNGAATMNYSARYYATATAGAGLVNATVAYTVLYQ